MKYEDYFKVEAPTFHVFTDEEIEKGDLPEIKEEKKVDNRDAKKAERLAKRQKKVEEDVEVAWDPKDPSAAFYGDREPIRSQVDPEIRFTKKFTEVIDISEELAGQKITIRGRLHTTRGQGGLTFIVMRQRYSTVQGVLQVADNISKGMVNFARKVPRESIVEIVAEVTISDKPIEACTQKNVEL
jgi:aspartyl-tRNA synthetase